MKRDIYITKYAVISATLACDSLYSADGDADKIDNSEKEKGLDELNELADELCKELSPFQLDNISAVIERAVDRHPRNEKPIS